MISLPNVANSLGTAFFNSDHLAAMIGSVPRGDRGFASGMIHAAIDLCHMLGVSLGGLSLSLAFQYYAGLPGALSNPDDPLSYVSSVNITYMLALGFALVALCTLVMRDPAKSRLRRQGPIEVKVLVNEFQSDFVA